MAKDLALSKAIAQLKKFSPLTLDFAKAIYSQATIYIEPRGSDINISNFISAIKYLLSSKNCTKEPAQLATAHAVLEGFCLVKDEVDKCHPNASNDPIIMQDIFHIINSINYENFLISNSNTMAFAEKCSAERAYEVDVGCRQNTSLGYLFLPYQSEAAHASVVGSEECGAAAAHCDLSTFDNTD